MGAAGEVAAGGGGVSSCPPQAKQEKSTSSRQVNRESMGGCFGFMAGGDLAFTTKKFSVSPQETTSVCYQM
jgi:hypothetical protein